MGGGQVGKWAGSGQVDGRPPEAPPRFPTRKPELSGAASVARHVPATAQRPEIAHGRGETVLAMKFLCQAGASAKSLSLALGQPATAQNTPIDRADPQPCPAPTMRLPWQCRCGPLPWLRRRRLHQHSQQVVAMVSGPEVMAVPRWVGQAACAACRRRRHWLPPARRITPAPSTHAPRGQRQTASQRPPASLAQVQPEPGQQAPAAPAPAAAVVPVTLITGFLGSGKTTLVNFILTAKHGFRCAVLLNEIADSADIERALVKEPEVGLQGDAGAGQGKAHWAVRAGGRQGRQRSNGRLVCERQGLAAWLQPGRTAALQRLHYRTAAFPLYC